MPTREQLRVIYCSHPGCNWLGPYRKWTKHMAECKHGDVPVETFDDDNERIWEDPDMGAR